MLGSGVDGCGAGRLGTGIIKTALDDFWRAACMHLFVESEKRRPIRGNAPVAKYRDAAVWLASQ
jgi:hypothetical protein